MTKIALLPERTDSSTSWRAIAGDKQSVGKTAGEALDAITSQLGEDEGGTLIIMQSHRPDEFFAKQQRSRLEFLMAKWRQARDCNSALPQFEQEELQTLVEAEVKASTLRAAREFGAPTW
ncbi:MAG TPA: hypothetical protein VKT77_17255 [Chthonomonadaceae bacterium]|nr:hypothetical protein [Chthonomonadaceae bacterium]